MLEEWISKLRGHTAAWMVSAALLMVALRAITPSAVDFLFDLLTVGLVWAAGRLPKV